jgi:hypothetical protein
LRDIPIRIVRPARQIGEPDIPPNHQTLSGAVMRNRLLVLLAAAVLLSACADDQHTTAPANSRSSRSSASGDVGATTQGIQVPQAKPTDQVGFTTAQTITSATIDIPAGTNGVATATCPAGTTLVGGGYTIIVWGVTPAVYLNNPNGAGTGWDAGLLNPAGGGNALFKAFARCAH